MKFKVKELQIKTRKYQIIVNPDDAKELGIMGGDRVQLKNVANNISITAIVEIGDIVEKGTTGLCQETCDAINSMSDNVCPSEIEVIPTSIPESIIYIKKLMDNKKITKEEIHKIVEDIVNDNLTDVELSAFITASYINGMTNDEIEWLTRAMIDTGEKIEFDTHPIMDKHSIGGVPGNKISLLIVPIVAANGLLIPKTSSRAITGAAGTADLMNVIAPVEFTAKEIKSITEKVGGVIAWGGATNIAPADDKLINTEYPLSIDPRSQLLASIMAKKGAVGADSVVIDIPIGIGTKVLNMKSGRKLARDLIELGERIGINVECAISYGSSPIGRTIGPILEVREALKVMETMKGPNSLIEKSISIAGILLEMGGVAARGYGKEKALKTLKSGKALKKFREIIKAQGGNPDISYKELRPGQYKADIVSSIDGYVIEVSNNRIVEIARSAGAPYDIGAGIWLHKKKGNVVKKGESLMTIFADKEWKLKNALKNAKNNYPIIIEGMILERFQIHNVNECKS